MYLTIQSHSLDDASLMTNNEFSLAEFNRGAVSSSRFLTIFPFCYILIWWCFLILSSLVSQCLAPGGNSKITR